MIIRKIIACCLLVLFAIGITPKRSIHNLVADHRDGRTASLNHDIPGAALSRAAFNCQCDNLVSESPFVMEAAMPQPAPAAEYPAHIAIVLDGSYSGAMLHTSLRGPPCC